MKPIGELHSLTTHDGRQTFFPDSHQALIVFGGYGAPPTDFVTTRGFRQTGVSEQGFNLAPRPLSVRLWHKAQSTRQDYWDMRAALHEFLRPNRGGPLTLTLRQPGGAKRSLIVRANPGLIFAPNEDNDWKVDETLEFIAFDPLWFDPAPVSYSASSSLPSQLVFPATFPITFGSEAVAFSTGDFVYTGTWPTWPTILLQGPYSSATLRNVAANINIYLTKPISADESRILTLTPGSQSLVDADGVNAFGDIDPNSNLIDFNIRPDPLVPGGLNKFQAKAFDVGLTTSITIRFNTRYFAI